MRQVRPGAVLAVRRTVRAPVEIPTVDDPELVAEAERLIVKPGRHLFDRPSS